MTRLGCLLVCLVAACGVEERYLIADGTASLELQEFETREIAVRYLSKAGGAVTNSDVRFRIDGAANGAALEQIVVKTDAGGIARTNLRAGQQSTFTIAVIADGADDYQLTVSVRQGAGGIIDVRVFRGPSVDSTATSAQVTIVYDIPDCNAFDANKPPPGVSEVLQSTQNVSLSGTGMSTRFEGLRADREYAVVAVATVSNDPVAKGCANKITMTQPEVDSRLPKTINVYLQPVVPDVAQDELLVETRFARPLKLNGVTLMFSQMANDPIRYIMERALAKAGGLTWKSELIALSSQFYDHLRLKMPNVEAAKAKFKAVADELTDLGELKVVSTLKVYDETDTERADWVVDHTFKYFLAKDDTAELRKFYFAPAMGTMWGTKVTDYVMSAQTLIHADGTKIEFDEHVLSIPLGEAVLGTILLENFNDLQPAAIFQSQVDCFVAGEEAWLFYLQNVAGATANDQVLVRDGIRDGCEAAITALVHELRGEVILSLQDSALDEKTTFSGNAYITRRLTGQIEKLTTGKWGALDSGNKWAEIGTFSGERGDNNYPTQ